MKFKEFKQLFFQLFSEKKDVNGAAIAGSYARAEQKPDSDIDAVVFCLDPQKYLINRSWVKQFGEVEKVMPERWGPVHTLRAFFKSGLEIEFNFCTLDWAEIPADSGTHRVVSDGFEILYDPTGQLLRLKNEVSRKD